VPQKTDTPHLADLETHGAASIYRAWFLLEIARPGGWASIN